MQRENYATGTVTAKSFTIDKTAPTITVSYDNNSARNGNYYKADRTATVTIIEHNFDVNRVNVSFSADDKKLPNMSGWSSSGDQHTATMLIAVTATTHLTYQSRIRQAMIPQNLIRSHSTLIKPHQPLK